MIQIGMKRKIAASAIFIFGAVILFAGIVRGFIYAPNPDKGDLELPENLETVPVSSSIGLPARIIIPKINVDTDVEHVGITFKGNMGTPKNIYNTGWYKYGTVPGEIGSAVIDGHVDNGFNLPGVFSNLKDLNVGDFIYVESKEKGRLRFVVERKMVYPYKEVPLDELYNKKDTARLNLVTCDGDWIEEAQTDENRLVVYTRLVTS